jgi:hypothetical protein
MFDDLDAGVVIADGRCGLRLTRVGKVGLSYPTLIEVRAGPFSGAVRDDTVGDYALFPEQLEALYQQLTGTAKLSSYEGFELSLEGGATGHILVNATILGEPFPSVRLTFEALIDQSYLPAIITATRREFPPTIRMQKS